MTRSCNNGDEDLKMMTTEIICAILAETVKGISKTHSF